MKRIALFVFMLIIISVWNLPAMAATLTQTQKQKSSIDSQLNSVEKKKKAEESKLKSAETKKAELENEKAKKDKEYQQAVNDAKLLAESIKPIESALKESDEKYKKQREIFKTRLKVMYENSNSTYIQTLLESKDISDFLGRIELISAVSNRDKQVIEDMYTAKLDLEFKKTNLENIKQEKQKLAGEKLNVINDIKLSRADVVEEIRKISGTIEQLEKQEDALYKKSQELSAQIRNLQKGGTKYAGGSMRWPVPSSHKISSYYGNRIHPIFHVKKMHTGIDISASSGVSIVAANKGTVIVAGWQNGYGNTVIIDHGGGISTLYAHASKLLVKVGANVKAGDTIAKVGSTGYSTGPHLHFEVRKNGSTANPLAGYVSP